MVMKVASAIIVRNMPAKQRPNYRLELTSNKRHTVLCITRLHGKIQVNLAELDRDKIVMERLLGKDTGLSQVYVGKPGPGGLKINTQHLPVPLKPFLILFPIIIFLFTLIFDPLYWKASSADHSFSCHGSTCHRLRCWFGASTTLRSALQRASG